jgi:hypothetical protein
LYPIGINSKQEYLKAGTTGQRLASPERDLGMAIVFGSQAGGQDLRAGRYDEVNNSRSWRAARRSAPT